MFNYVYSDQLQFTWTGGGGGMGGGRMQFHVQFDAFPYCMQKDKKDGAEGFKVYGKFSLAHASVQCSLFVSLIILTLVLRSFCINACVSAWLSLGLLCLLVQSGR